MHAFNLTGPELISVYVALALVTLALVSLRRRRFEVGVGPCAPLREPLEIAHLRQGPAYAVGLTVLSLLERDIIRDDGERLRLGSKTPTQAEGNALVEVLLERSGAGCLPDELASDQRVTRFFQEQERSLAARGFVPSRDHYVARLTTAALAIFVLGAVAAVFIGSIRDVTPTTVGLLWAWIFASAALLWGSLRLRTPAGERALRDLRASFPRRLAAGARLDPSDTTRDLLMLGAVHGYAALPEAIRLRHQRILPRGVLPGRPTDISPWVP